MPPVRADMALVAVDRHRDLHELAAIGALLLSPPLQRPAPVPVLLAELGGLRSPRFGDAACLEDRLLDVGVPLA